MLGGLSSSMDNLLSSNARSPVESMRLVFATRGKSRISWVWRLLVDLASAISTDLGSNSRTRTASDGAKQTVSYWIDDKALQ